MSAAATNPYTYIKNLGHKKLTSAEISLQKSFLSLNKMKPRMSISVTELCKAASVARTTFYSLYKNSDNLLAQIEDILIKDLLAVNRDGISAQEYASNVLDFIEKHKVPLHVLLVDEPDARFMRKWKDAVKFHLYDRTNENNAPEYRDLALEMVASMTLGAYIWYLDHPNVSDPEQLREAVRSSIENLR